MKTRYLVIIAISFLVALPGCVTRSMTIESEPSGASVTINSRKIAGTTPLEYKFNFYGVYHIILEKKGYKPKQVMQKVSAPLYDRFPLDLFADVLIPAKIKDHRKFSYKLEESTAPDVDALIDRAKVMREDYKRVFEAPAVKKDKK